MSAIPITEVKSLVADAVELAGGQRALARRRGVSQSDISQALNGGRKDARNRVLNALGYSVVTPPEYLVPMWGQNR
ncbi:putative transcriptional regulator [Gluconobacter cerinus]|uniref:helix-turn-helix domain-containing protein n=1 Tax=Gluconobacter cerinus TaxID=38307 RepID=UPI0022270C1A|nr:helix-turn-helix domain-containing protein [Gluconobacter cerinus]MCW2264134.1 putative transcriptional regulator [Gluconobacter cerinus]